MTHLGDRVAALVDGELDHDTRDRMLVHAARCAACRTEVDHARLVKGRVVAMPEPTPSADLTRRLLALAEPGDPLPPSRPHMPRGEARRPTAPRPGRPRDRRPAAYDGGRRPSPARRVPRSRLVTVGAFSIAAVALSTAFAVGGESGGVRGPVVTPAVDRYTVEHAATTGELPFTDSAFGAATASFSGSFSPTGLPSLRGPNTAGAPSR